MTDTLKSLTLEFIKADKTQRDLHAQVIKERTEENFEKYMKAGNARQVSACVLARACAEEIGHKLSY